MSDEKLKSPPAAAAAAPDSTLAAIYTKSEFVLQTLELALLQEHADDQWSD
jgi:hypothetical protein